LSTKEVSTKIERFTTFCRQTFSLSTTQKDVFLLVAMARAVLNMPGTFFLVLVYFICKARLPAALLAFFLKTLLVSTELRSEQRIGGNYSIDSSPTLEMWF
jgi:hypothetical protein